MKLEELITIKTLLEFEQRIGRKLDVILELTVPREIMQVKSYIRTKEVKKLLSVSDNKLRTMRESGEIPYSFIGCTYYYSEKEILNLLKENTIHKK
ncbi:MAG: helix-turn-helix domain-containing protein [Flavobacteriales bacterium]|nr:helix-turn-helix domain-containing protein [Flavobacteriales bacterium]